MPACAHLGLPTLPAHLLPHLAPLLTRPPAPLAPLTLLPCPLHLPLPQVGERVKEAMVAAFRTAGKLEVNSAKVVRLDNEGAKRV